MKREHIIQTDAGRGLVALTPERLLHGGLAQVYTTDPMKIQLLSVDPATGELAILDSLTVGFPMAAANIRNIARIDDTRVLFVSTGGTNSNSTSQYYVYACIVDCSGDSLSAGPWISMRGQYEALQWVAVRSLHALNVGETIHSANTMVLIWGQNSQNAQPGGWYLKVLDCSGANPAVKEAWLDTTNGNGALGGVTLIGDDPAAPGSPLVGVVGAVGGEVAVHVLSVGLGTLQRYSVVSTGRASSSFGLNGRWYSTGVRAGQAPAAVISAFTFVPDEWDRQELWPLTVDAPYLGQPSRFEPLNARHPEVSTDGYLRQVGAMVAPGVAVAGAWEAVGSDWTYETAVALGEGLVFGEKLMFTDSEFGPWRGEVQVIARVGDFVAVYLQDYSNGFPYLDHVGTILLGSAAIPTFIRGRYRSRELSWEPVT